jgi:hypothetical protein
VKFFLSLSFLALWSMLVEEDNMNSKAFFYYTAHQESIAEGHLGEFVAIKDNIILGYYRTRMEGLFAMAQQKLEPGTYIVHKCRPVGEPDMMIAEHDFEVIPAWTH